MFEKEKLDNAFLKVGAKLKQSGLKRESKWLENRVVANLNPDFSIKRVAEAREREAPAPKKKAAGSKRKAVQSSTKKKRAMMEEESCNDDDDDDSVIKSVDADDFMDDDEDVVSLSKLTADMDEQYSEDDREEIDDRPESGSESEAEFD